jgi:5-hydroxyisourate hydrolase
MASRLKGISTHILDLVQGAPARDVSVRLEKEGLAGEWRLLTSRRTDPDGRCSQMLLEGEDMTPGVYRLTFDVGTYSAAQKIETLYPVIEVTFRVRDQESHCHIPLLLSPNGYTTYRGS